MQRARILLGTALATLLAGCAATQAPQSANGGATDAGDAAATMQTARAAAAPVVVDLSARAEAAAARAGDAAPNGGDGADDESASAGGEADGATAPAHCTTTRECEALLAAWASAHRQGESHVADILTASDSAQAALLAGPTSGASAPVATASGPMAGPSAKPSPSASVSAGVGSPSGRLDADTVRRVVQRQGRRVRLCYEQALKSDPNLQVRLAIEFVIGSDGAVPSVKAEGTAPSGLKSCVQTALASMRFPPPDGGGSMTVRYPFTFTNASAPPKTSAAPTSPPRAPTP